MVDFFCSDINTNDLGFLYGFSLFETFLVGEKSAVLLLDRHIDRLFNSIKFFGFDMDIGKEEFASKLKKHIEDNHIKNKVMRVTVTYGNKLKKLKPSVIVSLRDNPYLKDEAYSKGIRLAVSKCKRDESSPIVGHKTANYLENYLELQAALKDGFDDAIFLNMKNDIAETTKSNIFFVKEGALYTPAAECGILPGVMREWVIEKAKDTGIGCLQGSYDIKMLAEADEVFVTNSVMGIMPVSHIEGYFNKDVFPGKITGLFLEQYNKMCD